MSLLYVLGGRQRKLLFKDEPEQRLYESGILLRLDTETGAATVAVDYKSPPEARSGEHGFPFKSSTLIGNRLFTCTSTEVLVFEVPGFKRVGYVSLPCFNDVHHVNVTPDGNLLAVSTGLDMVVLFTSDGKVLREWNVLGQPPWSRFSRDIDYRKVETTKPHLSHPNYVFQLGGEIWVTRFTQKDAVCLTTPGLRIDIGVERPHDGLVCGDRIYFTTVDGKIIIAGPQSHAVEQVIDLNEIHRVQNRENALLGWCRGVLPIDEQRLWVGFTRVRKTKFTENVLWVKHAFRETEKSTHIGLYDIVNKKCLQEIDLEAFGMNVIFGIHPVVSETKLTGSLDPGTNVETL
jgi:hypothetical protein